MATGNAQSAYLKNLPSSGRWVISPERFFFLTERNEMPLNAIALTSFGASVQAKINNVGIIAELVLSVTGTITCTKGAGSLTATPQFPWRILKRVIVSANGQNELISVDGEDLRARRNRVYRNATDPISTTSPTIADGATTVDLIYVLPFAHDDTTLIGSLYAQSQETYLNLELTTCNAADIITAAGGAVINSMALTVTPHLVFYEIPKVSDNNGELLVLPDLSQLHGFNYVEQAYNQTGDVPLKLLRSAGQLLCVYLRLDNDGASGPAELDPFTQLDEIRWEYAGNQRPRFYRPSRLLQAKMSRDYNGDINARAAKYVLLDFEVDNPMRDVVYPRGVIDLQVVPKVSSSVTVGASAKAHLAFETLYGGS